MAATVLITFLVVVLLFILQFCCRLGFNCFRRVHNDNLHSSDPEAGTQDDIDGPPVFIVSQTWREVPANSRNDSTINPTLVQASLPSYEEAVRDSYALEDLPPAYGSNEMSLTAT